MSRVREAVFITLFLTVVSLIVLATITASQGEILPRTTRSLAKTFLNTTYNVIDRKFWTASPEAVAAIVWDYRGLDTFYETIVFYTAIISCLMLYRDILGKPDVTKGEGLSVVVKRANAIATVGIIAVGASTILHGMITPGGGFQGGAIAAVAPVVLLVVFSRNLIDRSRLTYRKSIVLRNLAILSIVLTALLPVLLSAGRGYVFQNQNKEFSVFSYPSLLIDVPMGGSIWFYNLFEGIAVFTAFYLAFRTILYSEAISLIVVEGEDRGF
uniref:Sodium:proton antiporter n=1 Tax=Staphylothermus marinus TaxID=2280 RepID=A0A7C4NR48_STAMA